MGGDRGGERTGKEREKECQGERETWWDREREKTVWGKGWRTNEERGRKKDYLWGRETESRRERVWGRERGRRETERLGGERGKKVWEKERGKKRVWGREGARSHLIAHKAPFSLKGSLAAQRPWGFTDKSE